MRGFSLAFATLLMAGTTLSNAHADGTVELTGFFVNGAAPSGKFEFDPAGFVTFTTNDKGFFTGVSGLKTSLLPFKGVGKDDTKAAVANFDSYADSVVAKKAKERGLDAPAPMTATTEAKASAEPTPQADPAVKPPVSTTTPVVEQGNNGLTLVQSLPVIKAPNGPVVGLNFDIDPVGPVAHLEYATWGLWESTFDRQFGAYATGPDTPINQLPISGKATYTGSALARVTTDHMFDVAGNSALVANFTDQSVGFAVGNWRKISAGAVDPKTEFLPTLSGPGLMSENRSVYVGQISSTNGANLSGGFAGKFVGPLAIETVGVFGAKGASVTTGQPISVVGSFGARR